METTPRRLRGRVGRWLRSWQAPAAVGAVLLAGLVWWLSPWSLAVHVTAHWDPSNLYAFARLWWLWLLLAATMAVAWWLRGLVWGQVGAKVWAARFFLASMLAHAVLLMLLGWWTLPTVVDLIVTKVHEAEPIPDVRNDQRRPGEDGRRAFEKVADLSPTEPLPAEDLARADAAPAADAPSPLEHLAPTVPPAVARALPPERLLFVPPPAAPPAPDTELRPLTRRTAAPPTTVQELVEQLAALPAVPPPTAERPLDAPAALSRLTLPTPQEHAPGPPQLQAERIAQRPRALRIESDPPQTEPTITTPPQTADRMRRAVAVVPRVAVMVSDEPAPPVAVATAEQPTDIAPPAELLRLTRREVIAPVPAALPTPAAEVTLRAVVQPDSTGIKPAPFDAARARPQQVSPTLSRRVARLTDPAVSLDLPTIPVTEPPGEIALAAAEIALAPQPPMPLGLPDPIRPAPTLPKRAMPRPMAATLDETDTPVPSLDDMAAPLQRAAPHVGRVALAVDRVDLPSMFALRDEQTRRKYIELFGGTPATEAAVNRGLEWLARHQNPEGSWSLHRFHVPEGQPAVSGAGSERSDTAATGLALLAFLGGRHTHQTGRYQAEVAAAIQWLRDHQKPDGLLQADGDRQTMYSHGIAAIALCEAYGISRDPQLREPCRKALDFIVKAQHGEGGWRYKPGERGDTSVVGWQMMALKSGEMAGLDVPPRTMDRLRHYLKSVEGNQPTGGRFGYQNRHPTPAMTAEGLLCLQFLGEGRNTPRVRAGADYLMEHLPKASQQHTSYYWYYATQVMYHMQGDDWEQWNQSTRDLLVETQIADGPLAGTWDPRDRWEHRGGRLYATALKLLMLEVYYRHLPLYEQLDD